MVNEVLHGELQGPVHALSIVVSMHVSMVRTNKKHSGIHTDRSKCNSDSELVPAGIKKDYDSCVAVSCADGIHIYEKSLCLCHYPIVLA